METTIDTQHLVEVRGRALRFVLVDELMAVPEMSVAQLAAAVAEHGFTLGGRASKVISDALRWEVRRGRVVRLRRGWYAFRRAPASTARRIRRLASEARDWVAALRGGRTPRPTPCDPRAPRWRAAVHLPDAPPWWDLGWLWAT